MTVLTKPIQESQPIIIKPPITLRGISWKTYQALMNDAGDNRAWRIAYDKGVLELRMPLLKHETPIGLLESFIEALADELEIEILKAGALTLEREDLNRAIEPDGCFYIQNELLVRGKDNINLPDLPPPDLVIESDYTSSSLNKFNIYAALGLPELWRYHKGNLQVYLLQGDNYQIADKSLAFPSIPLAEIPALINQSKEIGQRATVRLFRQKIREILANQ